jgi:hypothetical protein
VDLRGRLSDLPDPLETVINLSERPSKKRKKPGADGAKKRSGREKSS